ncbi:MAG: response regulator transcription factor [Alphaproteobacteria bacterium]|nr:response regulator transcription factor [Alphaproteobacteria bacterium]MBU1513502.1 response regulator transcription factor [Alphaproteobacteria bacterium]MBU2096494.1 response regulator transcription factor [Alphaproteobacteria bacterium]MBU2149814.1 response regulator transcription factor [Alphaproteobacteria bacterium]MBU2305211.1 response regulator transcription factor [Alphaproteobacteria bacterium]
MKILVVDDHSLVRQGLAALLSGEDATTEVLHAGGLAEGLARVDAHPDLDAVLMDLNLPDGDGMAAIAEIARRRADLPVVILSGSEDPGDVRRALDLGALGYVPKSSSPETLIAAVRMVLDGGIYVPPLMLDAAVAPQGPGPIAGLTPRQVEVLAAVARGLSNKEIGLKFALSEKTVKAHVGAIFRTLGVANRTQAASAAMAARLIPPRAARPGPHPDE